MAFIRFLKTGGACADNTPRKTNRYNDTTLYKTITN